MRRRSSSTSSRRPKHAGTSRPSNRRTSARRSAPRGARRPPSARSRCARRARLPATAPHPTRARARSSRASAVNRRASSMPCGVCSPSRPSPSKRSTVRRTRTPAKPTLLAHRPPSHRRALLADAPSVSARVAVRTPTAARCCARAVQARAASEPTGCWRSVPSARASAQSAARTARRVATIPRRCRPFTRGAGGRLNLTTRTSRSSCRSPSPTPRARATWPGCAGSCTCRHARAPPPP
jgi:hypothetical protein